MSIIFLLVEVGWAFFFFFKCTYFLFLRQIIPFYIYINLPIYKTSFSKTFHIFSLFKWSNKKDVVSSFKCKRNREIMSSKSLSIDKKKYMKFLFMKWLTSFFYLYIQYRCWNIHISVYFYTLSKKCCTSLFIFASWFKEIICNLFVFFYEKERIHTRNNF